MIGAMALFLESGSGKGKPDGLLMSASMRRDTASVIQCLDEHIYFYLFLPDCLPEMRNLLQRIPRVGSFRKCVVRRAIRRIVIVIVIDGFPAIEHTMKHQSRHREASISHRNIAPGLSVVGMHRA
jgi:hypothetical protein